MQVTNKGTLVVEDTFDMDVAQILAISWVSPQSYQMLVYVPYVGQQATAELDELVIGALVEQGLVVPDNLTLGWGTDLKGVGLGGAYFLAADKKMFTSVGHPVDMYLEPETHKFTAQLPADPPTPARGIVVRIDALNPHYVAPMEVANEQLSSTI